MTTVVASVFFALVFAWWWVKKPEWSRHATGSDPQPRHVFSVPAEVPPPALRGTEVSTRFRPDIEGLRAVAVLLVLVYHARFSVVSGGFIGVDVFFVLSGFLITSLLLRELATTGTVSLANFWARRARRLLPASGLVLIVTLIGSRVAMDGLSQGDLGRDAIAACLFVANIRFWHVGIDYLTSGPESPLLHFWSLAVEEQFYMVWPGLLLLLVKVAHLSRRALWAVIGIGFVVSLVVCVWATRDQDWTKWAFFMLPARAWELLAGAGLALAGGTILRVSRQARAVLGWLGLGVILAVAVQFNVDMEFPGWLALLPVVATVLVINAGGHEVPEGPARILAVRPMVWIGARSYAIYLWHFPLLALAAHQWADTRTVDGLPVGTRIAVLVVSVVLAAVSYRLVEDPVRHSPALSAMPARSLVMGAWIALAGLGAAALLINNPPRLSTDEVAAEATLVTAVTTVPGTDPSATTVPGTADPSVTTTTVAATTTTLPPPADASHDNPPELAALIAANLPQLEAGVGTSKVPSNMSPSLGNARDDLPQVYDNGCILDLGVNQPKNCIYGDPNGSVTVVLFGDSHAAQWMPAMHKVALDNGWRLLVHVKKACPTAEIPTDKDPNRTDCVPWRERVIDQIEQLHPDLVVMSAYRYKQVGSAAGRDPDTVWREGIDLTVSKVRPLTDHLLLLGDSATPLDDVPSCVAGNVSNVSRCMNSREGAVRPSRLAVERDVAATYDADFIPTSDWMCTATACPVIVGNVLMYRDNSHITATASVLLAPYVEVALRGVLAG